MAEPAVFISHSHIDDPFVNKLASTLQARRIATFVDHHHIKPGEHWPSRVQEALKTCPKMIAVLSDHSVASRNCTDEWDYFLDWRGAAPKEIIPVRLSGTELYFRLSSFHYLDVRGDSAAYETAIRTLIDRLTDNQVETHRVPPPARDADAPLPAALGRLYRLKRRPEKAIGIATGNMAEIAGADALVNSENSWLDMDVATTDPKLAQRSVSAAIHSVGAVWNEQGDLVEDRIENELQAALAAANLTPPVPLSTVIDTPSGSLERIGVKRILHVVSVTTKRGRGSPKAGTPVQLARCVATVLGRADALAGQGVALRRIVFPVLGTGRAGMPFEAVAPTLISRAVEYLEYEASTVDAVYFVAFRRAALESLETILGALPDVEG